MPLNFTEYDEVTEFIEKNDIKWVDARFTDVPGIEQHLAIPARTFDEKAMETGVAFDGSSISGYTSVEDSDMTLLPDIATAYVDPFRKSKTLNIQFFVHDPHTGKVFSRDPRNIAQKAEAYLKLTGIADTCNVGSEAEFYIFDSVRYDSSNNSSFHEVDSVEGWWNSGKEFNPDGSRNLGHKVRTKGGYFPTAPYDHLQDLRDEIGETLEDVGFEVERAHHEMGSGGQQEVNYRFNSLLHAADDLQTFKYVVKNVAKKNEKSATFMPKPIANDGGSGMHLHMSLWKDGNPLFFEESNYGGLSELAMYFMGGVLHHAPAVLAFTNPTMNSYHRLVPGFEAPVNLVYSSRNRSATIRIPSNSNSPKSKRIEFRAPDPSGNPYLGFTAMLMAGLDGIQNQISPGDPVDEDLYAMPEEAKQGIRQLPASLDDALIALEADHDFLLAGDVFTKDLIDAHIKYKREEEIYPSRLRPTTQEFELYYDC